MNSNYIFLTNVNKNSNYTGIITKPQGSETAGIVAQGNETAGTVAANYTGVSNVFSGVYSFGGYSSSSENTGTSFCAVG